MIISKGNTNVFSLIQTLKKIERDHGNLSICTDVYTMDHIPSPKPSKWHRVEDEEPEQYKIVLVFDVHGGMYNDYLNDDKRWDSGAKITHWRKLPKPPEKAKTDDPHTLRNRTA